MVETTFKTGHAGVEAICDVDSNVSGELAEQAELVAFTHFIARVLVLLGPARAGAVVSALLASPDLDWSAAAVPSHLRAVVRFVDGASGPRLYFRLKADDTLYADISVDTLRRTLGERHAGGDRFGDSLARASELMGRLGATGQVNAENEFDVALAAADVAWRSVPGDDRKDSVSELECPGCGYGGPSFESRLWPSESAGLHRCGRCGAGVWTRAGHRARSIRPDIWSSMEAMRSELAGVSSGHVMPETPPTLLGQLKRVFADNGWPYSEITGAPVLVSELSGPVGSWDFYAQAVEERDLVLLYSIAPQRVPEQRRLEVSEFLTRANYGLADGNFELDFDDGEIRFKSVLHVPAELDGLLVRRVVRLNGAALETYLPSIAELIEQTLP